MSKKNADEHEDSIGGMEISTSNTEIDGINVNSDKVTNRNTLEETNECEMIQDEENACLEQLSSVCEDKDGNMDHQLEETERNQMVTYIDIANKEL